MSQVLGKTQPQDEDDEEEEEEDELVGLADYGDGPDSSDADPDSGNEEGGERSAPGPASPQLAPLSFLSVSPRPRPGQARGPPTWRESRGSDLGGGGEGL